MLYRVLLLVRFSILLGIVGGLVLVLNAQAQDVLRALGEEPDRRIVWFVLAAIGSAAVAWWSTRVMFYFRFRGNPASSPRVYPRLKEHLPRLIGASALGLIAVALLEASLAYPTRSSGPGATLVALGGLFIGLAAAFVYVTRKRRDWFLRRESDRPRDLRSVRELAPMTWAPLATVAAAGFALMVVFAYRAVDLAPVIGTAAVAMLAVIGLIPVASFLVYLGNRLHLPVVSLLLLWAAFSTYASDNHYVRVTSEMASHAMPPAVPSDDAADEDVIVGDYLEGWVAPLQSGAAGKIPVFIVAAEGGGIRAAYWTALVLGELQDRAAAEGRDFARHVFAISGVSGGSLGAAAFAALVANDAAKRASDASAGAAFDGNGAGGPEQRAAACPGGDAGDTGVRARAERVLQRDFLAPAVAVMLFPDLLQQLVPFGFLNDRAVALERAFEAAWDACEPGRRFARPFSALWSGPDPHAVPLLFLNSTVVETGQRLIEAPVTIREPEFNEAIDGRRALGPEVPLSTAVHNSARFTYVSPAGTVRRRDRAVDVDGRTESEWIRLVDGGYFENSGAVTAAEILDSVRDDKPALSARGIEIEPVVIHISNDPATTDPSDLLERRKWLNQPVAPVKALLHTRQARLPGTRGSRSAVRRAFPLPAVPRSGGRPRAAAAARVGAFGSRTGRDAAAARTFARRGRGRRAQRREHRGRARAARRRGAAKRSG
ncbi:MAG TPA: hypothetical protein VF329_10940 [Gammaproteobacteria bacterium]